MISPYPPLYWWESNKPIVKQASSLIPATSVVSETVFGTVVDVVTA